MFSHDENIAHHRYILIVDDEPYNLMGLRIVLKLACKKIGLKESLVDELVHDASNGEHAVAMAEETHLE